MDPLLKAVLLRTFGFLLWISFSAWLFTAVEYTEKDNVQEKYQLLLSLYDSMASKYNMTVEEFNNFSNLAHEALTDPKPQWTFDAAVDFVFQSLTTIGYGYITPQTPSGQILIIFVCLVGIPITLLTFKSIGKLIARLVNTLITKVEKKIFKRAEPKKVEVKSAVILFSIMVLLVVISAWISMSPWDLTFVEGLYFWFVTLTTIGFGDYTPFSPAQPSIKSINTSENRLNKGESAKAKEPSALAFLDLAFVLECTIGLCIMSGALNSIMAAIDLEQRKCHVRCAGCIPRQRQIQEDNDQRSTTPDMRDEAEMACIGTKINAGFQKDNLGTVSVEEIK